jgi:hypothetical protein
MVSKKLMLGGGESKCLEEKLAQLQAEINGTNSTPVPKPAVVAARGFVPRTDDTEREKEEARNWDRSSLLHVKEDDQQVKIYNDLARGPNNGGERPGRFGLGFGTSSATTDAAPVGPTKTVGTMRFVSSSTANAVAAASSQPSSADATAPPLTSAQAAAAESEWTGPHKTPEGHVYWYNTRTAKSEWTPPPGAAAGAAGNGSSQAHACSAQPLALASAAPGAQSEWTGPHTAESGHQYWYNTRTANSEWIVPQQQSQLPQPPPQPQCYAPPAHLAQYPAHPYMPQPAAALPNAPAAPAVYKPGCTLAIAGIPPDFMNADVRELFGTHGAITHLQLDRDSYSAGSGPKRGLITFDGSVGASSALKHLHGKQMRQHTLQVSLYEPSAVPVAPAPPYQGAYPAPGYQPAHAPGAIRPGGASTGARYHPY